MKNTNATDLRKNLFSILEQVVKFNIPTSITTKNGDAVLISAEDYNSLMETLYLCSIPGMRESIIEGLNVSPEERIPETEVQW